MTCIWWSVWGERGCNAEADTIPPLSLRASTEKMGHSLPADGETQVALHYFCLIHQFMLLLLWPEKVKYSLILKGFMLQIITTQAYRNPLLYSLIAAAVLAVGRMYILWLIEVLNKVLTVLNNNLNMNLLIETSALCCIRWVSLVMVLKVLKSPIINFALSSRFLFTVYDLRKLCRHGDLSSLIGQQ
jgi:hypothetical protein